MKPKKFKNSALTDALILGVGALLLSMPVKEQDEAERLMRDAIRKGVPLNDESERILAGIFLREMA